MQATEFGYSRKDVLLIGGGLIGLGYGMYYGLQVNQNQPSICVPVLCMARLSMRAPLLHACLLDVQAAGVEAGFAGNVVQLVIFLGICIGYISTYISRVANKVCSANLPELQCS